MFSGARDISFSGTCLTSSLFLDIKSIIALKIGLFKAIKANFDLPRLALSIYNLALKNIRKKLDK